MALTFKMATMVLAVVTSAMWGCEAVDCNKALLTDKASVSWTMIEGIWYLRGKAGYSASTPYRFNFTVEANGEELRSEMKTMSPCGQNPDAVYSVETESPLASMQSTFVTKEAVFYPYDNYQTLYVFNYMSYAFSNAVAQYVYILTRNDAVSSFSEMDDLTECTDLTIDPIEVDYTSFNC